MLEISPIMLALCFMLSSPHYAKNYAGIIDSSLVMCSTHVSHVLTGNRGQSKIMCDSVWMCTYQILCFTCSNCAGTHVYWHACIKFKLSRTIVIIYLCITQPLPAKRLVILAGSHLKMWHLSSKETGQALNEPTLPKDGSF